jgi:hypothetical protein
MSDTAINFSTPVAEMMAAQLPFLRISKAAAKDFNKELRKAYPGFVGLESEAIFDQIKGVGDFSKEGAGAFRKLFVEEMSKAKWKDRGFPVYDDILHAITEPDLLNSPVGAAGFSSFLAKPNSNLIIEPGHASYNRGIPGEYLGGLEKSVPPEIMFPKTFDALSQTTNKAGKLLPRDQQVGSLRSAHLWEVADDAWVERVTRWLRENPGSTYGAAAAAVGASMISPDTGEDI